ncbi:hypothetical protein FA95DRAFT_532429 [Auriscalpium vulgare]|uniref:Uncharacterized protein n=1 Tax=Auriscalpium vulgare TaxID=40419 RepID=A0ACB8RFT8_9AGAM|nr:hypothetical protein FA95DRAFT_532429 [Auriscalpium vulgare]
MRVGATGKDTPICYVAPRRACASASARHGTAMRGPAPCELAVARTDSVGSERRSGQRRNRGRLRCIEHRKHTCIHTYIHTYGTDACPALELYPPLATDCARGLDGRDEKQRCRGPERSAHMHDGDAPGGCDDGAAGPKDKCEKDVVRECASCCASSRASTDRARTENARRSKGDFAIAGRALAGLARGPRLTSPPPPPLLATRTRAGQARAKTCTPARLRAFSGCSCSLRGRPSPAPEPPRGAVE